MEAVNVHFQIKPDSFAFKVLERTFEAYDPKHFVKILTDCMNASLGDFKRSSVHKPELISDYLDVVKVTVKFLQDLQPEVFSIEVGGDDELKALKAAYEHFDPADAYEYIFQGLNDWIYQAPDDIDTSILYAYHTAVFYHHAYDIILKASQYYDHLKAAYNEPSK